MKRIQLLKRSIAIGVAGAMALCEAVPASAAPVLSSTVLVKTTAPAMLDQVRVRRGRAIGAGIALGVLGAAIGAAAARNQYYYGPGYYYPGYGPGYYGPGYYAAPGYYGPYGGYGYPYGYGYYHDRSGAIAAGAAIGMIGAMMGAAAARNPPRWGRYPSRGYYYYNNDPQAPQY